MGRKNKLILIYSNLHKHFYGLYIELLLTNLDNFNTLCLYGTGCTLCQWSLPTVHELEAQSRDLSSARKQCRSQEADSWP